jgi:hypothetical protein
LIKAWLKPGQNGEGSSAAGGYRRFDVLDGHQLSNQAAIYSNGAVVVLCPGRPEGRSGVAFSGRRLG